MIISITPNHLPKPDDRRSITGYGHRLPEITISRQIDSTW